MPIEAGAGRAAEEYYARWIAEGERHLSECPACTRAGCDCPAMEERLLELARRSP